MNASDLIRMEPGQTREEYLKRVAKYCRTKYAVMRTTQRYHCSHTANDVLKLADALFIDLGTFGVEGFSDECGRDGIQYLNTGDTYELTIAFRSRSERFYLTTLECIASVVERWER